MAVSLFRRVQLASTKKAAIFVSIHCNSSSTSKGKGTEIFYYAKGGKEGNQPGLAKRLGGEILRHLCHDLPLTSRGVKAGNFYVIREATMPSVLVETAFLTDPKDAKLLGSARYRQQIACAIAKGINEYFQSSSPARIERATCRLGGDRSIH